MDATYQPGDEISWEDWTQGTGPVIYTGRVIIDDGHSPLIPTLESLRQAVVFVARDSIQGEEDKG
jgi:hypothetical protein